MTIIAGNLDFFLSGGASNSDVDASLGGAKSSVEVTDDALNNLFDDVSGAEHAAGETNYRCIFVKNSSGADTAYTSKLYIETNTPGVDSVITIGLDLTGQGDTADTVADEDTAPDPAVTFTAADGYANGLAIGTLTPGQSYPIWIKRVITAGATAQALDNVVLKISVDTA